MVKNELKKIVNETIGAQASQMLLSRAHALLDEEKTDLKQACAKIEQLVSLFVGQNIAKTLKQKFGEKLQ